MDQTAVFDERFTAKNLENELSTIVKWDRFGTMLGVPFDRLEQIKRDNYDTDEQRQALIAYILKNTRLGWEDICTALEGIQEKNLARRIQKKYCSTSPRQTPSETQGCNRRYLRINKVGVVLFCASLIVCILILLRVSQQHGCSIGVKESQERLIDMFSNGNQQTVQFMVDALHIDPRLCRNEWGISPLLAAIRTNNIAVVKYLVEEWEWDIGCDDKNQWSPLHEACFYGHLDTIVYLMGKEKQYINTCGGSHVSLLHAAARSGQVEVAKFLVEEKGFSFECGENWSPLHEASYYGQLKVVKYLIEYLEEKRFSLAADQSNKDPCKLCVDSVGDTPLHAASVKQLQHSEGQLAVVKFLLKEKHCDPTYKNDKEATPFDIAKSKRNDVIQEYLSNQTV